MRRDGCQRFIVLVKHFVEQKFLLSSSLTVSVAEKEHKYPQMLIVRLKPHRCLLTSATCAVKTSVTGWQDAAGSSSVSFLMNKLGGGETSRPNPASSLDSKENKDMKRKNNLKVT